MATIRADERTTGLGKLLVLGLASVLVLGIVVINNASHATRKHTEAPVLRHAHENNLCWKQEAYLSPQRGTLLVLCKMDTNLWGGIVWKVLERRHGTTVVMDEADIYECTAFAADRSYWDRVIARDGYVTIWDCPRWLSKLSWIIWP